MTLWPTLSAFTLSTLLSMAASAEAFEAPTGDVVLTIRGDIAVSNAEDALIFDLDMLRDLPVTRFTTTTLWTEGARTFEGVSLRDLLEAVDADGTLIEAAAINDYTVEIPVSDAVVDGPIIAYSIDGEGMSVRDRGPLWIVYPYDLNADYQSDVIYARSIWQLDRMHIGD